MPAARYWYALNCLTALDYDDRPPLPDCCIISEGRQLRESEVNRWCVCVYKAKQHSHIYITTYVKMQDFG